MARLLPASTVVVSLLLGGCGGGSGGGGGAQDDDFAGYRLSLDPTQSFAILELPADDYRVAYDEAANVEKICRFIYRHFDDEFDFIHLLGDSESVPSSAAYFGRAFPVRNSVRGLNLGQYDRTQRYGSDGRLRSVQHFPNYRALLAGPSLHEILHTWGQKLLPPDLAEAPSSHWGFSSAAGQLGGFDLVTLTASPTTEDLYYASNGLAGSTSFGLVANAGNNMAYSEIELYMMGLLPISDVPELVFAPRAEFVDQASGFFTAPDGFRVLESGDLAARYGTREPAPGSSQTAFRGLVVLLTDGSTNASQLSDIRSDLRWLEGNSSDGDPNFFNFAEATGFRATLRLSPVDDAYTSGTQGADGADGEGTTLDTPQQIVYEASGDAFYLLDAGRLLRIPADGSPSRPTLVSRMDGVSGPGDLAVGGAGGQVFVADAVRKAVTVVDTADGSTEVVSGNGLRGSGVQFGSLRDLAVDTAAGFALVLDTVEGRVVRVELAGGARDVLVERSGPGSGPTLERPGGFVVSAGGTTGFIDDGGTTMAGDESLVKVDLNTGAREVLSDDSVAGDLDYRGYNDMVLDPANQRILAVDQYHGALVAIDTVTGERTLLSREAARGTGPGFVLPQSLAFDRARDRVLVVDFDARGLISVDLDTGNRVVEYQAQ